MWDENSGRSNAESSRKNQGEACSVLRYTGGSLTMDRRRHTHSPKILMAVGSWLGRAGGGKGMATSGGYGMNAQCGLVRYKTVQYGSTMMVTKDGGRGRSGYSESLLGGHALAFLVRCCGVDVSCLSASNAISQFQPKQITSLPSRVHSYFQPRTRSAPAIPL